MCWETGDVRITRAIKQVVPFTVDFLRKATVVLLQVITVDDWPA
jgi:hypothetical protein